MRARQGKARGTDLLTDPGERRLVCEALAARGIAYTHFPALGGRHGTPAEGSPNTGWRVASFGAYADYMATEPIREGLERLEAIAAARRTAMMCSEAVPWHRHRRLIADALLVRGWEFLNFMAPSRAEPHTLTDLPASTTAR